MIKPPTQTGQSSGGIAVAVAVVVAVVVVDGECPATATTTSTTTTFRGYRGIMAHHLCPHLVRLRVLCVLCAKKLTTQKFASLILR